MMDQLIEFILRLNAEQPPLPDIPYDAEIPETPRNSSDTVVVKIESAREEPPKTRKAPTRQVNFWSWTSSSKRTRGPSTDEATVYELPANTVRLKEATSDRRYNNGAAKTSYKRTISISNLYCCQCHLQMMTRGSSENLLQKMTKRKKLRMKSDTEEQRMWKRPRMTASSSKRVFLVIDFEVGRDKWCGRVGYVVACLPSRLIHPWCLRGAWFARAVLNNSSMSWHCHVQHIVLYQLQQDPSCSRLEHPIFTLCHYVNMVI